MRKLTILITVLCMASATQAVASGRYQGVSSNKQPGIYVVDTKTGKVRYCNAVGSACEVLEDK